MMALLTIGFLTHLGGSVGVTATSTQPAIPSCDTDTSANWKPISSEGAPPARSDHTAVWTGDEMLVWGGYAGTEPSSVRDIYPSSGGRYRPDREAWRSLSSAGAPSGRSGYSAVWTGTELLVWGGSSSLTEIHGDGGRYDPAVDRWSPLRAGPTVLPRTGHSAVWTGDAMLVWGGLTVPPNAPSGVSEQLQDGASYDPLTDQWSPLPVPEWVTPRTGQSAIWTGEEMIIWGGWRASGDPLWTSGAGFNPVTQTWRPLPPTGLDEQRLGHSAVWTGQEMLVWGGRSLIEGVKNDGAAYNPATDSWRLLPTEGAPAPRVDHTTVWTGIALIVWGGGPRLTRSARIFDDGGRYDPRSDTWSPLPSDPALSPRIGAEAVWTGSEMLVWGGAGGDAFFHQDGARYLPPC
jgi:N-acetylneuraminic acid mutarotase